MHALLAVLLFSPFGVLVQASTEKLQAHASAEASKLLYVPLTNDENMAYFGQLTIGTPAQTFNMLFSTGSADTWIRSATSVCTKGCSQHALYSKQASKTFQVSPDKPFKLQYHSGTLKGTTGEDVFHLGTLPIVIGFGQIEGMDSSFESKYQWLPFDGTLGLAYPDASETGHTPIIWSLSDQGLLAKKVFSLYLTKEGKTGSVLIVGGVDHRYFMEPLLYFPVIKPYVFWMIELTEVTLRMNGAKSPLLSICKGSNCRAVFDSGTSLISGPPVMVKQILDHTTLMPSHSCDKVNQEEMPFISFHFGQHTFSLAPKDYTVSILAPEPANTACFSGISAVEFPASMGDIWVFGTLFLNRVYSVFDGERNMVGLATPRI